MSIGEYEKISNYSIVHMLQKPQIKEQYWLRGCPSEAEDIKWKLIFGWKIFEQKSKNKLRLQL